MENCKKFLLSKGLVVVKVFRIPSKSEKGKFHIVEYFKDGGLSCDCVAGCFKRPCRHKKIASERLRKQGLFVI